jgi:hypothetical protein
MVAQVAVTGTGPDAAHLTTTGSSSTYFSGYAGVSLSASIDTTESDVQSKNRGASTLSNLAVLVASNARTTTTSVASRHSSGAGNLAISIGAGVTGILYDTTHSDALADGDTYDYQGVMGASSQALGISSISAQLAATSGQCFRQLGVGANTGGVGVNGASPNYVPFAGRGSAPTTEAPAQIPAMESATFSNFQVVMRPLSATTILTFRKNGVSGNETVSVSTASALVEDTTHTDTVVSGNLFNSLATFTGGSKGLGIHVIKYTGSTTNQAPIYTAGAGATGNVLDYWPFDGNLVSTATETNVQYALASPGTANNLTVNITANAIATNQSWQFRKNAANGNQVAVITASTTGVFTDATHTDACATGDLIDCSSPVTFTSSASLSSFGVLYLTVPAGTTYPVSVTEAGSGADTPTAALVIPETVTEAGAAADTESGVLVIHETVTETGAAADTPTAALLIPETVTETGAAADTASSFATLPSTVTESGSAADTTNALKVAVVAIVEAGAASDTVSDIATLANAISEVGSAADTPSSKAVYPSAISEAGAALDSSNAQLAAVAVMIEAGVAEDAVSAVLVISPAVAEAGAATDTASADLTMQLAVVEAGAAEDAPVAVMDMSCSLAEGASATDALDAMVAALVAVTEAGTAEDLTTIVGNFFSVIAEAGFATDAVGAVSIIPLFVAEAGAAADSLDAALRARLRRIILFMRGFR